MSSVTEKSAKYAQISYHLLENATSVVVNSTALNSKDPEKVFFKDDEIYDDGTSASTALSPLLIDADTSSRQDIDVVLLTKGFGIGVKNLSGTVTVTSDGSWVCEGGKHHTTQTYPDPLAEVKKQASVLESYLEQRQVTLLEGNLSCKVVIPNPNFRVELKTSKIVLGEFLEFKGKQEDMLPLKHIRGLGVP
ncbi:unnamed protein product [Eruca vesicaria subsp. sativa]|uniref:NERD domain-containing protein n=1 Tax=Eruca vesicaria subsp. sativa TaxID=29727 RepID=A0ABC8L6S2_ERUVS|nr:unnamed protein product [Eruca vesicaria subsp. sativa]